MRRQRSIAGIFVFLTLAASALQSAHAQLPSLDNEPWRGYFAVHAGKRFQFGIVSQGDMHLKAVDRDGAVMSLSPIPLAVHVREILPNGTAVNRPLNPESLETSDSPTDKLEKTVFRAKAEGGASFEVTVEQSRGMIFLGGRILDPGTLKNPLCVAFSAAFANPYPYDLKPVDETEDEREKKKLLKAFEKKIHGDSISLKWTDGKRLKQALSETVDVSSKEITGPGIAEFEMDVAALPERKFVFTAAPNSSMTLSGGAAAPIYQGFSFLWAPDPAKNADGKARLAINVR